MFNEYIFRLALFSTDYDNYSPISIFKQFFPSQLCSNVNYIKKEKVEFDYNLDGSNIHTQCNEISDLSKQYNICFCADLFLIFINLEDEINTLNNLEKILKYINDTCDFNIKSCFLGILNNNMEIPEKLKVKSLDELIKSIIMNPYEYKEFNIKEDFENIYRIFASEIIENKFINEKNKNNSNSKVYCSIY